MDKKWVKLIENEKTINLIEQIEGLTFLQATEEDVEVRVNSIETNGTDGIMLGPSNFGPFPLKLNFFYRGMDVKDYKLMKQKLRGMLFKRTPYYIVHSDSPGKKYAVYCEENAITDIGHKFGTFEITFTVYKGYSESLYDTDNYNLSDGLWQFESGVLPDSSISYEHTRQRFDILNGSNDTINPRLRHKLKIYMRLDAPNGFKLINTTTGDIFHYKVALDSNDRLLIDGAYPWLLHDLQDKRCGRNTNHGVITLAPGINKFEIWGNVSNTQTKFTFPFIYR
ncbi:phage tail family protein [Mammaliicoccus sciuri]|uniref:phage tail family protein n=1 Tax=Mammaliicoccus sciuri TaxID=1296 RepID=UPI00288500BF|nr:phage tail family protein [Mammaliicoccus sciuri]MDT0702028.1 phage tail family protein [Mammaliicoccus sciuri]